MSDEQLRTPRGIFKWPRLRTPDTKYKDEGEYSVKLVLSAEAAAPLIKKLQPFHDDAVARGKEEWDKLPVKSRKKNPFKVNDLYAEVYDEETEEPTGDVEFNFKTRASGVSKKNNKAWNRKVPIFDAKGKPVPESVDPWGGSEGIIAFTFGSYFTATAGAGLSLRLEAVQVLKLVAGGGGASADSYGFEAQDGGYSAPEVDDEDDYEDSDDDADDNGADDEDF